MQTMKNFDVLNKKVLVRVDFNVPLSEQKQVLDNFRIQSFLPTIIYLLENNAKIILISHFGRPKLWSSQESSYLKEFSLKPVVLELEKLLKRKIKFLDDCIGVKVKKEVEKMKPGEIILLENLRFYREEEANNSDFARALAKLGDIYINDAFAVCHRNHASIVGTPKYLPSCAGFLLSKEYESLSKIIQKPARPLLGIIGGVKIETKLKLLSSLINVFDYLLVGGVMANVILRAKGFSIETYRAVGLGITVNEILLKSNKLILPIDVVVAKKSETQLRNIKTPGFIKDDEFIFDIGSETQRIFCDYIKKARTIFWNGPLGFIENKLFASGSETIAQAIAESSAFSVIGGGETIKILNHMRLEKSISHISTGGGAMLSFLSGQNMPGIEALKN